MDPGLKPDLRVSQGGGASWRWANADALPGIASTRLGGVRVVALDEFQNCRGAAPATLGRLPQLVRSAHIVGRAAGYRLRRQGNDVVLARIGGVDVSGFAFVLATA